MSMNTNVSVNRTFIFIQIPSKSDESIKNGGARQRQPRFDVVIEFSWNGCHDIMAGLCDATVKRTCTTKTKIVNDSNVEFQTGIENGQKLLEREDFTEIHVRNIDADDWDVIHSQQKSQQQVPVIARLVLNLLVIFSRILNKRWPIWRTEYKSINTWTFKSIG